MEPGEIRTRYHVVRSSRIKLSVIRGHTLRGCSSIEHIFVILTPPPSPVLTCLSLVVDRLYSALACEYSMYALRWLMIRASL